MVRKFDVDLTDAHLEELASDPTGCLETYQVELIRSYVCADKRTLVCILNAPDAEAVRAVAKGSRGMVSLEVFAATEHRAAPPQSSSSSSSA